MIRIAVVGAGHWGPNLIRNFHNRLTSEVVWVIDRDQNRLDQVHQRQPDVPLDSRAERAFEDPKVDAVVLCTPTATHYALAKAALEAGKHVLVEKPIATAVSEGEHLTALARQKKLVLMVGHVFVYNAAVQRVKKYLDDGELGRVYYVSMVRTNLGPIRLDVDAAWDLASHDISVMNHWLSAEPLTASAVGGTWVNPGLADAVFATLRYPNDVLLNLHVSWLNPRKARDVTVVADKKMLTFNDLDMAEPLRIYDKQVTEQRTRIPFIDTFASYRSGVREGDVLIPRVAMGEPLRSECDHFLECVEKGKAPKTGGQEATAVVRALAAMERSMRNAGREENVT